MLSRTAMFGHDTLQPQSSLSAHILEGKLKILDRNQKYEDIFRFYPVFCGFRDFYCDAIMRNIHVSLGYTKTWSPEICTVLHWRPLDIHIFHTHPSLYKTNMFSLKQL